MLTRLLAVMVAAGLVAAACSGDRSVVSSVIETDFGVSTTSSVRIIEGSNGVTVVMNARIYTVDENNPWADGFAYDQSGTIIAVGRASKVIPAAGEGATIINAGGGFVLPGFQDPRVHVPEAGLNLDVCFFADGLGLSDYEELAVECAEEQSDSDWVRAAGASLFELRDTAESPLVVLDRAIPDRPAIVLDNLGHAVWTNSAGLKAAGITANAADPQGGVFHRDRDGNLTGLLLEDAQHLVRNVSAPDDQAHYNGLLVALEELAANGITTVSDAGGYWAQNHPAAWERAQAEGTLTVRAMNSLYLYPDMDMDAQLDEFERRFSDNPTSLLQFDTAKVYVDGILDLGTALLLDPYDVPFDDKYPSGFSYFADADFATYVNELHQLGYRVSFHAIGDAAVQQTLDAVEQIDATPEQIANRRHRSTHTYLVAPADIGRFEELGVVVDFQQSDDAIATDYHEYLFDFIGERAFELIPTAALLDADATVSMSSDWDAGPLPTLGTIERSLTRDTNAVLDLETAVALVTIEAAYALGHDDRTGSIEVGKQADFVVLDRSIFDGPIGRIDEANVLLTVVDGTVVFER